MPSKTSRPHIVWFRDDLRLSDHPALAAASQEGAPVICLHVFDEASSALRPPRTRLLGDAARWWLAQSLQSQNFDPDGGYGRRQVPELAELPPHLIHQPWTATLLELAGAGVTHDKTYPPPIVDHKFGRERALAAYAKVRNG